ncbi:Uncharacterised protein [Escherichia coli]|nr:Uncharacterised protein [Escherichia coli]
MDKVTDNSPDVESTESTEGSFPTVGVDTGDTITATLATGTENVGGWSIGGASESSAAIHEKITAQLKNIRLNRLPVLLRLRQHWQKRNLSVMP